MDKSNHGVHAAHCCIKHGCKYGDEDCPVVSGEIKQEYVCEYCSDDGIKSVDEIKTFYLDYKSMWNELKNKIANDMNKNTELTWSLICKGFLEWMQEIESR